MFNNVGFKLRCLAIVGCFIGIGASVITGIVYVIKGVNAIYGGGEYILIGILIAVLGSFFSWLGSLSTYALGEAAENSQLILIALKETNRANRAITPESIIGMGSEHLGKCSMCGQEKAVRECTIDSQGEKKKINICSNCMCI